MPSLPGPRPGSGPGKEDCSTPRQLQASLPWTSSAACGQPGPTQSTPKTRRSNSYRERPSTGPGVRTLVTANPKQQQAHARAAQAHQRKRLLDNLPSLEQDKILQASGPGAGSFMQPAVDLPPMEDRHFLAALRRRLRVRHCVHGAAATCCHHTRADHRRCGKVMPADNGTHAVSCRVGGGWEARHNAVRDAVGHWLEEGGYTVFYEQEVPRWNRPEERAILDVVYRALEGHTTYVDLALKARSSTDASAMPHTASRDASAPSTSAIPALASCLSSLTTGAAGVRKPSNGFAASSATSQPQTEQNASHDYAHPSP